MKKVFPSIWSDNRAIQMQRKYVAMFKESRPIGNTSYPQNSPVGVPGGVMTANFSLENLDFVVINGGDVFHPNPSVSFFTDVSTTDQLLKMWSALTESGKVMMELKEYPFSSLFGWVEDEFGVSWQLNLSENKDEIKPFLMFANKNNGKGKAAIDYYTKIFPESKIQNIVNYTNAENEPIENIKQGEFTIFDTNFVLMETSMPQPFDFSEGMSFCINCKTQAEIDYYWDILTADGGEESVCGWLKDKFGLSWQVIIEDIDKLLSMNYPQKAQRVHTALLQMKKIDIKALYDAYDEI